MDISKLDGRCFDVVVIGAGAAGASAAQNLAAQGYEVLLADKGDLASGTSGRSSRLLYCGLANLSPDYPMWRFIYRWGDLANRLRMARLAMRSRAQLVRTMPDRLSAHQFFFPVFRDGTYSGWKVDIAYRILSLLGDRRVPLNYHRLPAEQAARRFGLVDLMDKNRLLSVGAFTEYQYKWAERIVVDTVLDAERMGVELCTYARVTRMEKLADKRWAVILDGASRIRVEAEVVVNAAGPWINAVNETGGLDPARKTIGVKGINLLVRLPDSCRGQGMETLSSIDQPFYCMPWGDHHFFGPTETVFEGDADDVRVLPEEEEFILGEANRVFPSLGLTSRDVVYRWSGVRPRTADGAQDGVYRSLHIHDLAGEGMPNVLAVTGMPIMIHRHAGKELARIIAGRVKPSRPPRKLDHGAHPQTGLDLPVTFSDADPEFPVAAIIQAAREEHAITLQDIMFRRVPLGWRPDMGIPLVRRVAEVVAPLLGWDEARIDAETDAYFAFIASNFDPAYLRQQAPAR